MSNFKALIRVELKDYWSKTSLRLGLGKKGGKLKSLLLVFLLFTYTSIAWQLASVFYKSFDAHGVPELTFTYMYLLASLFMLMISITSVMNSFFFSNNLGFLLTLPLKENTIIMSKLAIQYLFDLLCTTVFLLPTLFIYYSHVGVTALSLIGGLLALLLTPLLPMIIAGLFVMIFMSVAGKRVRRNTVSIIVSILAIVLLVGMQVLIARQMSQDMVTELLLGDEGLLYLLGLRFPPSIWATRMIQGNFLNGIYFVALNIGLLFVLNALSRPLLKQSMRAFQEGSGNVRVQKAHYSGRTPFQALLRRNILIIIKTPTFLLNALILIFLPFIMIAINMATGQFSIAQLRQWATVLAQPEWSHYRELILAGLMISPAFMGTFSATVITREGKYLWQSHILPISVRENLRARIWSSNVISYAAASLLLICGALVMPVSIYTLAISLILGLVAIDAMSRIDLLIDIYRPILNWMTPTQAIKNNLNILIALGWRLLLVGIVVILLRIFPSLPLVYYSWVLLAVFIGLSVLGRWLIRNIGETKYANLEF